MLTPEERAYFNLLAKYDNVTDVGNILLQMMNAYENVLKHHNIEIPNVLPSNDEIKIDSDMLKKRLAALQSHVE